MGRGILDRLFKPKKQRKGHTHPNSVAAYKEARKGAAKSQIQVMRAMHKLNRPVHYRILSQYMNTIEGCVTPRLAELKRKGFVKVAYVNIGFNKKQVNFYELTWKGKKALEEAGDSQ
jgi:hypothetical protein